MIRMYRPAIGLGVVMLATLPGCAPMTPSGDKATSDPVTASMWALRSFQYQNVPRSRREVATLRLMPDHSVAGTASCNSVGGRELAWTASTDRQGTFARDQSQPTIMTVVGCGDVTATELAGRFWTMMATARAWSINNGNLTVRFGDGTTAVLQSVGPAPGPPDCRQADPNNFDCPRATTGQRRDPA